MIYNFSPGPSMLPPEVLHQAHEEFLNWHQVGSSVMEISHRSTDFINLTDEIEQDCREILQLPSNYQVLFLPGGARGQFAAAPLNLAAENQHTAYVVTGLWSQIATQEAKNFSQVDIVADGESTGFKTVPNIESWQNFDGAAYLHYTDNETVHGIEFPQVPEVGQVPLICDMSSNILSRPLDVTRFGLIYAGAQKNLGISGITLVIVRDDLVARHPQKATPTILNYGVQVKNKSMYNTPPTFPWYISGLVLKWIKKQGGLVAIGARNQRKSEKLYSYIDQSGFYNNSIDPAYRSRMNVIFSLPNAEKDKLFVKESLAAGLHELQGHKTAGGMRASLYNAMPEAGVDALIDFMRDFAKRKVT